MTWLVNGIGLLVLPITVWQFAGGASRSHFLWLNLCSSSLWAVSLGLSGEITAALVSLTAGLGSLGQVLVSRRLPPGIVLRLVQLGVVLTSVGLVFALAPPKTDWAWLPLLAFLYMRVIETLPHLVLRWLVPASPIAWIAIACHAEVYTLIPADMLSLGSALYWLWQHYRKPRHNNSGIDTL